MKNDLSTKDQILRTAEAAFAEHGFDNTTITQIASRVGIRESTIYEHFRNKEDILFSIPLAQIKTLIESNERHLRGLVGGRIKLRKLIYNYFDFLAGHPVFTRLLIFELRPNRLFYETETYEWVRVFYRPFQAAIAEAQAESEFRSSIDPYLLLNLVFGTVDHLILTWLLDEPSPPPYPLLDPFFDLLEAGASVRVPVPAVDDKRKMILEAAASVFSRLGYRRARIQDVARLAGVGDGTIYQYFKNKEDLLFSLPIEHTRDLISTHGQHFRDIKDTELRLMVLVNDYLNFLELHRDYTTIVLLELRYNRGFYKSPAYGLFRDFARVFYDVIQDGVRRGHFHDRVNPYVAVKMIFGAIDHCVLPWLMFERPTRLVPLSKPLCDLFLRALRP